jgi:hypothetical protein
LTLTRIFTNLDQPFHFVFETPPYKAILAKSIVDQSERLILLDVIDALRAEDMLVEYQADFSCNVYDAFTGELLGLSRPHGYSEELFWKIVSSAPQGHVPQLEALRVYEQAVHAHKNRLIE